MHVTGRNNRLSELISKFNDFLIQLDQVLIGIYAVVFFVCKHKCIISKRLDFQIIIKIDQSGDFRFRCISKQCLVKLPGLAGTSYQKSLSVLQKKTLWHSRSPPVIFQMRLADQLVQINSSSLISCKDDCMVRRKLLDRIDRNISLFIQCIHI